MRTQINGRDATWPPEVQALWDTVIAPDLLEPLRICVDANYFTPRPATDEYNRGSDVEGFTYSVRRPDDAGVPRVYQTVTGRYTPGTPAWDRLMALRDRYRESPDAR